MSIRILAVLVFSLCALAQSPPLTEGVSLSGEVHGARSGELGHLLVELDRAASHGSTDRASLDYDGRFRFESIAPGSYTLRVLASPGAEPLYEQPLQITRFSAPLNVDLPERPQAKPISGLVSVHELQHPPSKKAVQALLEAQRYSQAHDSVKAIEKLEKAIRIEPSFRDAHLNLGVQFVRTQRIPEAMDQFQTAIDIGPPDAKAYSNLAFCYIKLSQFRQAEEYARKALKLDPANAPARALLDVASAH